MLAALTATIVDAAYGHTEFRKPTPVYSVSTQVWKYNVLGNRSASKDDAVKYVQEQLGDLASAVYGIPDHDAADAYCIGRYLWIAKPLKLTKEK